MEFLLVPAIVVAALIYAIVKWRRRAIPESDPGIGSARRFYFYSVSFIAMMMATSGVVLVGQWVLEELFGPAIVSPSTGRLAAGVALTFVGFPLWAVHWRLVQRHVAELPVESRSLVRKVYVHLVLGVAVGLIVVAAIGILHWAFRTESFRGYPWASLLAWGFVWAFHWRLESNEGQPTEETLAVHRLYLYLVALSTLIVATTGIALMVHVILREGYESVSSLPVRLTEGTGLDQPSVREALAVALVGSVVWGAHWLYFARRDQGSTLRQVYVYLFGVFGGAMAALAALGVVTQGVLVWLLGGLGEDTAAVHFRFLPGAGASFLIGAAVWGYHGLVASAEGATDTNGVRRIHRYLLVAVGLGISAVGVSMLVATLVGLVTEAGRTVVVSEGAWRNQLATVMTLGVLGIPLWGYNWVTIQRRVDAGGVEERAAQARRVFILVVLLIGVLALLGSVSVLLFFFLRDALEGELSLETLRDSRAPLGIIAAAAVFLPYYWLVSRADSRDAPDGVEAVPRPRRKSVTVLVASGGEAFVQALEDALGYSVMALHWVDDDARLPQTSDSDFAELAQRVGESTGANVLLVPDAAETRILSYD